MWEGWRAQLAPMFTSRASVQSVSQRQPGGSSWVSSIDRELPSESENLQPFPGHRRRRLSAATDDYCAAQHIVVVCRLCNCLGGRPEARCADGLGGRLGWVARLAGWLGG